MIRKSKDSITDSQQTPMLIRGVVYQHWSSRRVWFLLHRAIPMISSTISLYPYFLYNPDSYSFLVLSLRNLTRGLSSFFLQVFLTTSSVMAKQPSFKKILTQVFPMQDVSPSGNISSDHNPSIAAEEFISINGEDISVIHSHDLTDILVFRQLYLIGKIFRGIYAIEDNLI